MRAALRESPDAHVDIQQWKFETLSKKKILAKEFKLRLISFSFSFFHYLIEDIEEFPNPFAIDLGDETFRAEAKVVVRFILRKNLKKKKK